MPPIPEQRTQASQWLGRATSPLVSLGNSLRESRVFQPSGICFHAEASPKHGLPSHFRNLAHRLSGDTLVRLSGGLWQEEHRLLPDVLNCSIRFKAWPPLEEPTEDAQDLVLLSTRAPWALAIDSLKTNQHDFLLNEYYSLAPLEIDGRQNISLRLIPNVEPGPGQTREEKIRAAVKAGDVVLDLQIRENDRGTEWKPLLEIRLEREVQLDSENLHIWPFRDGQGIRPQGWLEVLRPIPDMLDRLASQTEGKTELASHTPASHDKTTSRQDSTSHRTTGRLGQAIAETAVEMVNGLQASLENARHLASQAREAADSLLRKTLRTAQTSAADATLLATASSEAAEQTIQEVSDRTRHTAKESLRKTRKASRQTAQKMVDRAVDLGNRTGEAVAQTSAEVQKTAKDTGTQAGKAGSQVAKAADEATQDIGQRTQQAAATIREEVKESVTKSRRRRGKTRAKSEQTTRPH